jgi:ATP-binding cassette, subfamily F, member 3
MIQVKNVSFSHFRPIFKDINFTVGEGQKVGLAGPNGAGKSTLFNLLTRVELPKDGEVITEGTLVLVPQEVKRDSILEKCHTAREYLDESYEKDDKEINDMLRGLELTDIELYESPHRLSGGQKTKLAIARALLHEPDILLLDEPTNFLDIKGKKWVMDFLRTYPKTLILVSHDMELLDKLIKYWLSIRKNISLKNIKEIIVSI